VEPRRARRHDDDARGCECGGRPELVESANSDYKICRVQCERCRRHFKAAFSKEWAWVFWERRDGEGD